MEEVFIPTQMDLAMRENGKRTNNMDKVLRDGLMELATQVNTLMVKSMEKESSYGLIRALIQESSLIITLKGTVSMNGLMDVFSMVIGSRIKWRVMVHLLGLMVESTLVSTMMT